MQGLSIQKLTETNLDIQKNHKNVHLYFLSTTLINFDNLIKNKRLICVKTVIMHYHITIFDVCYIERC